MKEADQIVLKWVMIFGWIVIFIPQTEAATLDWDNENWPSEAISASYSNVDGSGVDIKFAMTGNTSEFLNNYPAHYHQHSIYGSPQKKLMELSL